MALDTMIAFNRSLLAVGERLCCAVSGGADSVALLLAAVELNARKDPLGVVLSAAHVHHGLRGSAADDDEGFVCELCARLSVPLQVFRVDTPARQLAKREGMEEAARALRYAALWNWLAAGHADVAATAHTQQDQAETVMMKLLRGAWTEGLGGIAPVLRERPSAAGELPAVDASARKPAGADGFRKPRGARIVRPLLEVRRPEVEAFLRSRGQPWREDESNSDLALTRNRVRHRLMPELRSFNPNLDEALARTAAVAREEEAFWAAELARVLPGLLLPGRPVRGGGRAVGTGAAGERGFALEIGRLQAMPLALARRVLREACRQTLGVRLGAEETQRLLALAGLAEHPTVRSRIGARLDLGSRLRAERSARELQMVGRFGVGKSREGEKEGS